MILWTIGQNNVDVALASISHSSDIETEIRNSVRAGKVATIHDSPVAYAGGTFVGYTIIDPVTGAGAYKIGGGENGGLLLLGSFLLLIVAFLAVINPILAIIAVGIALVGIGCGLARINNDASIFTAFTFLAGLWFAFYISVIAGTVLASVGASSLASTLGGGAVGWWLNSLSCL